MDTDTRFIANITKQIVHDMTLKQGRFSTGNEGVLRLEQPTQHITRLVVYR